MTRALLFLSSQMRRTRVVMQALQPAGPLPRGAGQGRHTKGGAPSRGRAWLVSAAQHTAAGVLACLQQWLSVHISCNVIRAGRTRQASYQGGLCSCALQRRNTAVLVNQGDLLCAAQAMVCWWVRTAGACHHVCTASHWSGTGMSMWSTHGSTRVGGTAPVS
jgi:hypothetical protein